MLLQFAPPLCFLLFWIKNILQVKLAFGVGPILGGSCRGIHVRANILNFDPVRVINGENQCSSVLVYWGARGGFSQCNEVFFSFFCLEFYSLKVKFYSDFETVELQQWSTRCINYPYTGFKATLSKSECAHIQTLNHKWKSSRWHVEVHQTGVGRLSQVRSRRFWTGTLLCTTDTVVCRCPHLSYHRTPEERRSTETWLFRAWKYVRTFNCYRISSATVISRKRKFSSALGALDNRDRPQASFLGLCWSG